MADADVREHESTSTLAEASPVTITVHHKGNAMQYSFPAEATLVDLSDKVSELLSIPATHQKFLISPKPGLVKPPFDKDDHASLPLSTLTTRKITLLGSTPAEVASLNKPLPGSRTQADRRTPGPIKPATPAHSRDFQRMHDDTTYTFMQCRPLSYLPRPERSMQFLERLRDDPGIRASMRKHKWSVPLLTEMNPAEHTTHESRTLGLNRNRGEVIELRLRTDAYDGYRDYRTIRKTLCHELAHNVWGDHDRNFWDLCHQIEREVDAGDWKSGGKALTSQEYYEPQGEEEVADHGGWTGGEFVLGGGTSGGGSGTGAAQAPLSRRDVLAKAAEERMKKQKDPESGS